jgi:hypothetical protein
MLHKDLFPDQRGKTDVTKFLGQGRRKTMSKIDCDVGRLKKKAKINHTF